MPSVPSDPVSSPSRPSGSEARQRPASKEGRPPFRELIEEGMPERPTDAQGSSARPRERAQAPANRNAAPDDRAGAGERPQGARSDQDVRGKPATGDRSVTEQRKSTADSETDAPNPAVATDAKAGVEEGKAVTALPDLPAAVLDVASVAPNVGQADLDLDPAAGAVAAAVASANVDAPAADDVDGETAEGAPADTKISSAGARSISALDPTRHQNSGAIGAKGHSPSSERADGRPIDAREVNQVEAPTAEPKEPQRAEPRDAKGEAPPEHATKPADAVAQGGDAQRASVARHEPAPPWLQTMTLGERAEPVGGRDGLSAIHDLAKAGQHALQADSAERVVRVTEVGAMIATRAAEGKSRFDIRLDPPELGRVEVRLEIKPDGDVRSHLIVERTETLDLLRRDAPQLERVLQSAGLKGDGGIEFSLRDHSGGQGGWNGHASRQQPGAHTLLAMAESSPAGASAGALSAYSVRARSGIDIQV